MDSIWTKTTTRPSFNVQSSDIKTGILIVGSGMTGILCAYLLDSLGMDYVLVEADRIANGITKNTTAKITIQHGLIYDKLIHTFGIDAARMYLKINRNALSIYRDLCKTIDCDLTETDSYVYSLLNSHILEAEMHAYHKLGIKAQLTDNLPLPFSTMGAVMIPDQLQFHPLKFTYAIARNLNILEQTKVMELSPHQAVTNHGTITADKIIIATHFPILNKHGSYFLKLYQERSYVLALKNAPLVNGVYRDEHKRGLSFRSYNDMLLIGGGSHRTGKKGGSYRELTDFAKQYYPDATEVARWATQDCMSLDGIPYIGQYSKHTPDLYVATGFNKWGMTFSMVAALILADLVRGKENPYETLFSPSRSMLHKQLAINMTDSLIGLITPTVPRCPHMGCALKYNKHEHSWDCPCHGSRFTYDGKLIDNPATDDKRIK